jgi:hypothetical protein
VTNDPNEARTSGQTFVRSEQHCSVFVPPKGLRFALMANSGFVWDAPCPNSIPQRQAADESSAYLEVPAPR